MYVRQWSVFTSIGFYFIFPGIAPWFLDIQFLPLSLIQSFITAFQTLNMFLAVVMISGRNERTSPVYRFIDLLSVFVTDEEYDARDFENELCLFEEISDATSIPMAQVAHYAEAVFDSGDYSSLYIRSDPDIGPLPIDNFLRSWFSFALVRMPLGKLARIEER